MVIYREMEENQFQGHAMPHQNEVSFPQPKEPGGKSSAKIIIAVIGVILIVVVGGWLILGNNTGGSTATPTPVGGLSDFPSPTTETPTPDPTATPTPAAKEDVKIEVLNGTGVPGEASFLENALTELGFENIEAGNADEQNSTETVATYSRELSPATADEITAKLEEIYDTVRTRRATVSGDFDVSITTGPRKAGSATASPKASVKASATPTASPTASATSTASPTPTPTSTN